MQQKKKKTKNIKLLIFQTINQRIIFCCYFQNVTFRNEVLKAMVAFLKAHGDTYPLTCRLCQRTYRSALGILLHIEACGATDTRVPCDFCQRQYTKGSLPSHMRGCSQRVQKEEEKDESKENNSETVLNNVGRFKRVAVQR